MQVVDSGRKASVCACQRKCGSKKGAIAVAAAAGVLLLSAAVYPARAQDYWQGNTSVNWADAGNWSPAVNAPPASGDSLVFGTAGSSGTTLTDNLMTPATYNVAGITFNAGAAAFIFNASTGSNGFALTGPIANNGTALETINDLIAVSSTQSITTSAGGGNITLGGVISGNGSLNLGGSGTITLGAAETYTGNTNVMSGSLVVVSGYLYRDAASTATVSVASGGTLNVSSGSNNALAYGSGASWVVSGTLSEANSGKTMTIPGSITLNGGTLTSTSPNSSGYGAFFGGAGGAGYATTLTANGTGNFIGAASFGIGGTMTLTTPLATDQLSVSTPFFNRSGGTGNIVKTGLGTVTFSGSNTYTGGTNISSGTVQFAQVTSMPAAGAVTVAAGATLAVNAGGTGEFTSATSGNGSIGGLLSGLGGQSGGTVSFASGSFLGIDTTNAGGSLTYSANITNSGLGLTKLGAGALVLGGNNSYTGNTNVASGTLVVAGYLYGDGQSSTTTTVAGGATLNVSGGSNNALSYGTNASWVVAGTIIESNPGKVMTIPGNITLTNGGTLASSATNTSTYGAFFGGSIGAGYPTTLTANGSGNAITAVNFGIDGVMTLATPLATAALSSSTDFFDRGGPGSITKTGLGTLTLAGSSTYSGGTTINAGTVIGGSGSAYNGGNAPSFGTGPITVNSGATVTSNTVFGVTGGSSTTRLVTLNGGTWNMSYVSTGGEYVAALNMTGGTISSTTSANYFRDTAAGLTVNTLASGTSSSIATGIDLTYGNATFNVALGSVPNGQDLTIAGAITQDTGAGSGAKSVTKLGTGTLVLSGSNTYTGNTTVSAGTLLVAGSLYGAGGNSANLSVASNATVNATSTANNVLGDGSGATWTVAGTLTETGANAVLTLPGNVVLDGGTLTSTTQNPSYGAYFGGLGGAGYPTTITANGTGNTISATSIAIVGAMTLTTPLATDALLVSTPFKDRFSPGSIVTTGLGTVTLSGSNTYTGTTNVSSGTLVVSGSIYGGAANSSTILVAGGATLNAASPSNNVLGDGAGATWNVSGTLTQTGTNAVLTLPGNIFLTGGTLTSTSVNADYGSFFGGSTGAGYATTITASGSGNTISATSFGVAGTLTLAVPNSTDSLLTSTPFMDRGYPGSIAVTGSGTVTMSVAATYSGGTNVSSGTLLVTNTTGSATGSGAVTIASGATLGGTGTITGPVTVNGTVFTGLTNNTAGKTASVLTLGSGSTLAGSLLEDLTGVSSSDQLAFSGSSGVTLGGSLVVTNPNSITFANGQSYDILSYGSNPVTGTFSAVNVPTLPAGLQWNESALYTSGVISIVSVSSGPSTLTWNNSGSGGGDGQTWDTVQNNWNNGSGSPVAYSDNSNTSSGDNVIFNDNNNGNYTVVINSTLHPSSTTFSTNSSSPGYNVSGGGIAGPGSLTLTGSGTVTLSSTNSYTGGTFVNNGILILASAGAFPGGTNLSIGSTATSASVVVANHGSGSINAIAVNNLSISGTTGAWTGLLDLTNNAMVLRTGSIATVTNQMAQAYSNGNWNGSGGITSSTAAADTAHLTAVGVIINDTGANTTAATGTPFYTSLDGTPTTDGDILVKYTYYGDADLSGSVDGSDYSLIDNGYLNQLTGWYNGDFNYDGVIDGSDYTLIDNAYNTQGASLAAVVATATAQIAGTGTSAVPEPASLGLLALGTAGLLGRRNRRRSR